jgi:hypothetical protein
MDYSKDMTHLDRASIDSTVPTTSPEEGPAAVATAEAQAPTPTNTSGRAGANATSMFLDELAKAMQVAAERERERIDQAVAEDAAVNIEHARVRAANETSELRRSADNDIDEIQTWLTVSIEQLQREATMRTDDRRARLDEYLRQHDLIIRAEIASVDAAVNDYGTTLDGFFSELHQSTKPSEIASKADLLPTPPELDAVRAMARASAVTAFADREDARTSDDGDSSEVAGMGEADSPEGVDSTKEVDSLTEVQPAAASSAAMVGVMDPALPAAPYGPPNVLHDVEGDPARSPGSSTEAEAEEPSAAVRLVRSFFSRTDVV